MSTAGRRVLVTRAAHQGSDLADRLRTLGLEPVLVPTIETVEPTSFALLDTSLRQLHQFHWLLFTSANAVEALAARSQSPPRHAGTKIAAIGPATAKALHRLGLTPDLVPPQAVAESFTEALLPHARQPDGTPTRFLLVRAEEARDRLPTDLRAAGAEVTIAPAYRTILPAASQELLRSLFTSEPAQKTAGQPGIAAITFTSSSTARNLVALCEAAGVSLPETARRVSIGPITSQTLRELGLPPHAEAHEATVAALADAVVNALAQGPS